MADWQQPTPAHSSAGSYRPSSAGAQTVVHAPTASRLPLEPVPPLREVVRTVRSAEAAAPCAVTRGGAVSDSDGVAVDDRRGVGERNLEYLDGAVAEEQPRRPVGSIAHNVEAG